MDYWKLKKCIREKLEENGERISDRAEARTIHMSQKGYISMMEKETLTVKKLEDVCRLLDKPVSYFFVSDIDSNTAGKVKEYNQDAPDLPEFTKVPHHGNSNAPEIKTYSCPDCIAKQKEIDRLTRENELLYQTLDAKEEALEGYRGKRENNADDSAQKAG